MQHHWSRCLIELHLQLQFQQDFLPPHKQNQNLTCMHTFNHVVNMCTLKWRWIYQLQCNSDVRSEMALPVPVQFWCEIGTSSSAILMWDWYQLQCNSDVRLEMALPVTVQFWCEVCGFWLPSQNVVLIWHYGHWLLCECTLISFWQILWSW